MTVEAGRKLGRYVLSRKIGAGGMAEVWEAFDEGLHRSVAVKVVRDEIAGEAEFRERFIREARLAAQLEHPRILPIYDFGTETGVTYLVMPLLPGGSLKEQISGPMPADEAVEALAAIAAALDHAHGRGVLHRDVKPSNVLVDASGSLLLADFGLAKNTAVSSELTVAGMVVGTPAYMAPEQAVGRPVDARADQYALGIVAFELLTGRTPFRSESPFAILDKHLREAPPPPSSFVPDLPPEVDAVLAKALAKQPQERFGTCRQMVEALAAALGASMPMRPSTAIRAARPSDPTWIADTAATLPPMTPRPTLHAPARPPDAARPADGGHRAAPGSRRTVVERGGGRDRRRGAPLHRRGGGCGLDAFQAEGNAGGASRERRGPSDSGAGRSRPDADSGNGGSRRDAGRGHSDRGRFAPDRRLVAGDDRGAGGADDATGHAFDGNSAGDAGSRPERRDGLVLRRADLRAPDRFRSSHRRAAAAGGARELRQSRRAPRARRPIPDEGVGSRRNRGPVHHDRVGRGDGLAEAGRGPEGREQSGRHDEPDVEIHLCQPRRRRLEVHLPRPGPRRPG